MAEIDLRYEALMAKRPELVELYREYYVAPYQPSCRWRGAKYKIDKILWEQDVCTAKTAFEEFNNILHYLCAQHEWITEYEPPTLAEEMERELKENGV